jgi:hypothetical protein
MRIGRVSPAAWILAVALGVGGLAMRFGVVHVTGLGIDSFWFVTVAFAILALAPLIKPR